MSLPNILLILADQFRHDCLGVAGHPLRPTPHLDALAASGQRFTQAYCPIPLCIPCRASLLTGRWPTGHQSIANFDTESPRPFDPALPTYSQVMRDAGYYLGYVGKSHGHREPPTRFGFHEYQMRDGYGPWRQAQGLPPPPKWSGWFGQVDPGVTPEQSALGWEASLVIQQLRQRQAAGQPFFLRWDPGEPHLPNIVPEPFASQYAPASIAPWPSFAETFAGKPYIQAQQLRSWGISDWTWEQWAPVVARYLGTISLLDAQLGRVLAELARLGLADNTIVIFSADHGDMCGAHRMIDKHYILYDDVVRVPLIIRWPGVTQPGSQCEAFVCHALDLAASFVNWAGRALPLGFAGQDLTPLLRGQADNGRQDIFASYHGNQFGLYSQRMVRDAHWKYIWNATAEDELYDLRADPAELHNLATSPAAASELAKLRGRLLAWLEQTRDPLLNYWVRGQLAQGRKV